MSTRDYQTSTVEGAAAWAEGHAEPDYDDGPTDEECRAEAEQDRVDAERDAILSAMNDLFARLENIDDDEESQELQEVIDRLYPSTSEHT